MDKYMIAMVPNLCYIEFRLGDETHRMPIDPSTANDLITRLRSFLPHSESNGS